MARLRAHGNITITGGGIAPQHSMADIPPRPYTYRGTGDSDPVLDREWAADELAGQRARRRAGYDLAAADLPVNAPREWHQELAGETPAPSSALATSAEARDAALAPPKLIVLHPVPDPETGGQVFEQPRPPALPAPEPAPVAEARTPAGGPPQPGNPALPPVRLPDCPVRLRREG